MVDEQDELQLRRALEVAKRSRDHGNRPFGAVLVGPLGEQLLEAENTQDTARDCTGHAECNLVRLASTRFDRDYLAGCTLYAAANHAPCAPGRFTGATFAESCSLSTRRQLVYIPGTTRNTHWTCRAERSSAVATTMSRYMGRHYSKRRVPCTRATGKNCRRISRCPIGAH